ncbi:MAG: OmpH family outer membrane protein [Chlamydiia bacterium]
MAISRFITGLALACSIASPLAAKEKAPQTAYGFVNSENCVSNSLRGKKERELFEKQKVEMDKILKDLESQLNETHRKRSDQDYLDALSPAAIDELNQTYQNQIEDIKKMQQQYYQVMQQYQGRMYNVIHSEIKRASEKVAKDRNLSTILQAEAAFYSTNDLDVTKYVIEEMDFNFSQESK